MKLKVKDQIHVSDVRAETLRPGEQFEVSDARGKQLLTAHPGVLEEAPESEGKAAEVPIKKAEVAPQNKAERPPENKAEPAAEEKLISSQTLGPGDHVEKRGERHVVMRSVEQEVPKGRKKS